MVRPAAVLFLASLAAVSAAVVSACGGGSPASPTFSPTNAVETDTPDASLDDAPSGVTAVNFATCGTTPATGSFPADVAAVLMSRCQPCHTDPPLMGAPFPLLAYADVHKVLPATTTPIYQEMYLLIQPGADPHMPFGNAPQLSTEQFNTLSNWLLSCAPPGD
jgi:uncharacterized membrane protein